MTPPRPPSRVASSASATREAARALDTLRLSLVESLRLAGVPLSEAVSTADAWLLAGLAAEELGLGGAMGALASAVGRAFAPVGRLVRDVGRVTGLAIALPVDVGGLSHEKPQAGLPFTAFSRFHGLEDPFGALAQALRGRHVVAGDGQALSMESSAARRDEGGYYTSYKLARRLAERALEGFDEVPAVIDPACGAGTFLAAAFDVLFESLVERRRKDPSRPVEPVSWAVAALHGVEVDATALLAARLSLAVRAVKAEAASGGAGQLALFGQAQTYGPLIVDRLRLGDALLAAPSDTTPGTVRLARRLLARDEPGRLGSDASAPPVRWDADFPLRFADAEGSFRAGGGFDLVITNPPFVPIDRIPKERREALMKALSTAQRRFDLFIGFVERAVTLLAAGGRATLLIPRTFLTESNAEKARALLLDRMTIERLEELGPVAFDGARVECVAVTFTNRRPTDGSWVELVRRGERKPVLVHQTVFRRFPRSMLRLELADARAAECVLLAERSVPLGRYFCASWGARGTPVKEFHLDAPTHPLAMPMIKGDDVSPFRVRDSSRWLLYDLDRLYRPSRREFFENEKLVVRKVSGAAGLVAAVDAGRHYTDDSLACVVRKADLLSVPVAERRRHGLKIAPHQIEPSRAYDLHLVAALLQTAVVQTYYRVQLGGGLNVFPGLIEALPLPKPEMLALPEAARLADLARAAARGHPFPETEADGLARLLYGLDPDAGAA